MSKGDDAELTYEQRLQDGLSDAILSAGDIQPAAVIDALSLMQAFIYVRYIESTGEQEIISTAKNLADNFVRDVQGILSAAKESAETRS